jgi:hypothetical protein
MLNLNLTAVTNMMYSNPIYVTNTNDIIYSYIIDKKEIYSIIEKIYTCVINVISLFISK